MLLGINKQNLIKVAFCINLVLIVLIGVGALPRQVSFLVLILILLYVLFVEIKDALCFFVASIPFFIALPITSSFDNFNTWRIVLIFIFIKWFIRTVRLREKIQISKIKNYLLENRLEFVGLIILIIAVFSVLVSGDLVAAGKRIVYFINLGLLFFVVEDTIRKNQDFVKKLLNSFLLGAMALAGIGILQWISAYLLNFNEFHYFWAKQVELGFYGQDWSEIAYRANTWYNYSGGGLRLRMFSVFPDSHSFPIYLIWSLIAFFYLLVAKNKIPRSEKIKSLGIFIVLAVPIIFSQTRGIWLAMIVPIALILWLLIRKVDLVNFHKIAGLALIVFIFVFLANMMISYVPQFKINPNEQGSIFLKRLTSIINLDELSNAGRIQIWKRSISSIVKRPVLGVGIGNFPTVLGQTSDSAKAGSSAHNLYLNAFAEIGVLGGILFLLFLWMVLKNFWFLFRNSVSVQEKALGFFGLISLIWILAYSMTDAALSDERAFLGLMLILGIISGFKAKKI
jgi:O-antigen ligase